MPESLLGRGFVFVTEKGRGIGVTAYSLLDAKSLIEAEDELRNIEITATVEDIDIRDLDQGHVIPNMLPPNLRGIWFPNLGRFA